MTEVSRQPSSVFAVDVFAVVCVVQISWYNNVS
jgi:hypothetical protein